MSSTCRCELGDMLAPRTPREKSPHCVELVKKSVEMKVETRKESEEVM